MLDVYLFREDRVLPYRHMFYQYGDIQLATAQDVLADSKGDGLSVVRRTS